MSGNVSLRSIVSWLLRLAVTALLLGLALREIDVAAAMAHARNASPWWLAAAFLLLLGQLPLLALRLGAVITRLSGTRIDFRSLLAISGVGQLAGQVLPAGVGVDVARVALLAPRIGIALGLRSAFADRVLGLSVLGALSLLGAVAVAASIGWSGVLAAAAIVGAAGALLPFVLAGTAPLLRRLPSSLAGAGAAAADMRVLALGSPALALNLQALAIHGANVGALASAAVAVDPAMPLIPVLLVAPLVILLATLPLSFGGWGVREGAMIVGLGLFGIAREPAFSAAALFGIAALLQGVAGWLLWTGLAFLQRREARSGSI